MCAGTLAAASNMGRGDGDIDSVSLIDLSAAPFRTGLLASLSMGVAWAGVRLHRPELMRLGYPVLAIAGIKVILEDFNQGQSLPLFVSLIFCGGGLVLLPRLLRKTPSYFAQANKSSTR